MQILKYLIQIENMYFLLFYLPFLASATKPSIKEWEVTKSVPLMAREYVSIINDFSVCRGCFEDVPDIRFIPDRPAESLLDIVDQLTQRHIPQILGLMDIIDKTGTAVKKTYNSSKRRNNSALEDLEEQNKAWYVQMRLATMRGKLLSLAEEGTVFGHATKYGAEVKKVFNARHARLDETLTTCYDSLLAFSDQSFKAELGAHPTGGLTPNHRKQFQLVQDNVSRNAAWHLIDFMQNVLVPSPELDDCLYGEGACRGQMAQLVAFLEDELIPFLRTIYGIAWAQPLPHRHEQWRDTFVGWFSHTLTTVVDFDAAGVGLAHRELETAIFKVQRHLDTLRRFQREDPTLLARRLKNLRLANTEAARKATAELEAQVGYMEAVARNEPHPSGDDTRYIFYATETLLSIRTSLRDAAERLYID